MSLPLILACLWVVAASIVAFLPLRLQYVPGLLLLLIAPVLILWIGATHGWLWSLPAALALISMFRRPLAYLIRKTMRAA